MHAANKVSDCEIRKGNLVYELTFLQHVKLLTLCTQVNIQSFFFQAPARGQQSTAELSSGSSSSHTVLKNATLKYTYIFIHVLTIFLEKVVWQLEANS